MAIAEMLSRAAAELALFAGVGFLLFGINDVLVDLIYFARAAWRSMTVYRRHARFYANQFYFTSKPGFIAMLVPAWDESAVIASMLKGRRSAASTMRITGSLSDITTTTRLPPRRSPAFMIRA
jgi:adsorption protein B